MLDIWQEIFSTMKKNKLRTFLTGFSVAWGIFMLIILLGSGNGLKNGVTSNFSMRASNSVSMWPGFTSIPFEGMQKGRRIKFEKNDMEVLGRKYPDVSNISASLNQSDAVISYGKEYGNNTLRGIMPGYAKIKNVEVKAGNGRFINEADLRELRKVMVMHRKTADILFRQENPLGKYVIANQVAYKIIGIYEDDNTEQAPDVFIPLTTAEKIYNSDKGYNELAFTVDGLDTDKANDEFDKDLRAQMAAIHRYDPTDNRAVWMWNMAKDYVQTMGIFNGIDLFVWVIGIGTLIAGIVGVSNIMLITVKERTREFGIRKALGATPLSILKLIILEAIVITGFFGYVGMVAGVGVTELLNYVMNQMSEGGGSGDMTIFRNPTVDLSVVISATVVLILSGILAGYFPARKAVSIRPIEALRYE